MTSITTQIPDKLNHSLCLLAKELNQSPSDIVNKAIEAYIQELQEDVEDYKMALESLKNDDSTYSYRGSYGGIRIKRCDRKLESMASAKKL